MCMDKRTNEQMNESISRLTSQRKKEAKKKGITNKLKKKVDNEERGLLGTRSSLSLYMCVYLYSCNSLALPLLLLFFFL